MTLKPTPPNVPGGDDRPMAPREWIPIVCIILIVIWLFVDRWLSPW